MPKRTKQREQAMQGVSMRSKSAARKPASKKEDFVSQTNADILGSNITWTERNPEKKKNWFWE